MPRRGGGGERERREREKRERERERERERREREREREKREREREKAGLKIGKDQLQYARLKPPKDGTKHIKFRIFALKFSPYFYNY